MIPTKRLIFSGEIHSELGTASVQHNYRAPEGGMEWIRRILPAFEDEFGSDELINQPDNLLPQAFNSQAGQVSAEMAPQLEDFEVKVLQRLLSLNLLLSDGRRHRCAACCSNEL